jgi:hypothetical protein
MVCVRFLGLLLLYLNRERVLRAAVDDQRRDGAPVQRKERVFSSLMLLMSAVTSACSLRKAAASILPPECCAYGLMESCP